MSIRCIFLGKYTAESIKGIMGGSDRLAAVEAVVKAAGGTVNMVSFTRGPFDILVDMNLPSQDMMMGAMATVEASGSIKDAIYLECIDANPIFEAAKSIVSAYTPANA